MSVGLELNYAYPSYLWNPATDELTETTDHVNPLYDQLALTGETIRLHVEDDYPDSPWYQPFVGDVRTRPIWNVIKYEPTSLEFEQDHVILAGSPALDYLYPNEALEFPYNEFLPRWVLDGQAILIGFDVGYTGLIYRDGTIQNFAPNTYNFLAGTPDGWLEQRHDQNLYHVVVENGELVSTLIELPNTDGIWNMTIAQAPPLGASVTEKTFAPYDPAKRAINDCATISLEYGATYAYYGEFPIGYAFELQRFPDLYEYYEGDPTALEVERPFRVLDGPICVEEKEWWFVEYEGVRGWLYVINSDTIQTRLYEGN